MSHTFNITLPDVVVDLLRPQAEFVGMTLEEYIQHLAIMGT